MGQLLRIIIILLGLWLVLTIVKRALSSRQPPSTDKPVVTKMVACAYCGVHVPESEAIHAGNRHYCSTEHQKKVHLNGDPD